MIKLLRQIFPQGKEGWVQYFDWCGYHSYVFKPMRWVIIFAGINSFNTSFPANAD